MSEDQLPEDAVIGSPFGSTRAFLEMVALPLCGEYFEEAKREPDLFFQTRCRRLFAAVVALDSVLEYLLHEYGSLLSEAEFRALWVEKEPALAELHELANALKHCRRGRFRRGVFEPSGARSAPDVAPENMTAGVEMRDGGSFEIVFSLGSEIDPEFDDILTRAHAFWVQESGR